MANLLILPNEIKSHFTSYLSLLDIHALSETCKLFYEFVNDNNVWKELVSRYFKVHERVEDTWKEEFKFLSQMNESLLLWAVKTKDYSLLKFAYRISDKKLIDLNIVFAKAVGRGSTKMINFIERRIQGKIDYIGATKSSVKNGNFRITQIMLKKMKENKITYSSIDLMEIAIKRNNCYMVKWLFDDLIKTYNPIPIYILNVILDYVIELKNIKMLEWIIEIITKKYEKSIPGRAYFELGLLTNNSEFIEDMINRMITKDGSSFCNFILQCAIRCNHHDTVNRMITYIEENHLTVGKGTWQTCVQLGEVEIMELLLDYFDIDITLARSLLEMAITLKRDIIFECLIRYSIEAFRKDDILLNSILKWIFAYGSPKILNVMIELRKETDQVFKYHNLTNSNDIILREKEFEIILDDVHGTYDEAYRIWTYKILKESVKWGYEIIFDKSLMLLGDIDEDSYHFLLGTAIKHMQSKIINKILEIMQSKEIYTRYTDYLYRAIMKRRSLRVIKKILMLIDDDEYTIYHNIIYCAITFNRSDLILYTLNLMRRESIMVDYQKIISFSSGDEKILKLISNDMKKDD